MEERVAQTVVKSANFWVSTAKKDIVLQATREAWRQVPLRHMQLCIFQKPSECLYLPVEKVKVKGDQCCLSFKMNKEVKSGIIYNAQLVLNVGESPQPFQYVGKIIHVSHTSRRTKELLEELLLAESDDYYRLLVLADYLCSKTRCRSLLSSADKSILLKQLRELNTQNLIDWIEGLITFGSQWKAGIVWLLTPEDANAILRDDGEFLLRYSLTQNARVLCFRSDGKHQKRVLAGKGRIDAQQMPQGLHTQIVRGGIRRERKDWEKDLLVHPTSVEDYPEDHPSADTTEPENGDEMDTTGWEDFLEDVLNTTPPCTDQDPNWEGTYEELISLMSGNGDAIGTATFIER